MTRVRLHDIASARAGDKGNTSNISLWAFDPAHYPAIKAQVTPERLKASYPALFRGRITRYCLDALFGLNFVIEEGLEGGVNASLNLDAHGKSFSFLVLALEIDLP
jgi:hypothetical protein